MLAKIDLLTCIQDYAFQPPQNKFSENDTIMPSWCRKQFAMRIANDLLRSNEEVQAAYAAMRKCGNTDEEARTKIAKAILERLLDDLQGYNDRFSEIISALGREQKQHSLVPKEPLSRSSDVVALESSATRNSADYRVAVLVPERLTSKTGTPHETLMQDAPAKPKDQVNSGEGTAVSPV
jgi:hypothetical protein